jgi:hypothetical protein
LDYYLAVPMESYLADWMVVNWVHSMAGHLDAMKVALKAEH